MTRTCQLATIAIATVALTACVPLRERFFNEANDRVFIDNAQFIRADQLYDECGTLDGVQRTLKEKDRWKRAEINEAIYRLRKVHNLPQN